jgi:hypothetical protein
LRKTFADLNAWHCGVDRRELTTDLAGGFSFDLPHVLMGPPPRKMLMIALPEPALAFGVAA